jgi:hypothetical protein
MSNLIEHRWDFNRMYDRTIMRLTFVMNDQDLKCITLLLDDLNELQKHLSQRHKKVDGRQLQKERQTDINEVRAIRTKHALPDLAGFIRV